MHFAFIGPMSAAIPARTSSFSYLRRSLGTIVLVTAVCASAPVEAGHVSRASNALRVGGAKVGRAAGAFTAGTVKDGPKHTWLAIKAKPVQYTAMLLGIGAIGAGAHAIGINPEPLAIGLSAGALGLQLWKSLPEMRQKRGNARLRSIGANVIWPTALAVGTVAAGKLIGHGPSGHGSVTLSEVGAAGAKSVVIAGDAPTIAQTAMRSSGQPESH